MKMKKGDRVKIVQYDLKWNGKIGTIDRVDGWLVYVFLDCQPDNTKYPFQLYYSEVEKLK
jgi:hypothetical protein